MKKVIVASRNPVKIEAARKGYAVLFGEEAAFKGVAVPSGVSDQPTTDSETREGARNRAGNARASLPDADLWIGIEGGIEDTGTGMQAFAWVAVYSKDRQGEARTGTFLLPPEVARLVRQGVELGEADDRVFNRTNSKQKVGAVGILTDGAIDRASYYEHAVTLALVPFYKPDLYPQENL